MASSGTATTSSSASETRPLPSHILRRAATELRGPPIGHQTATNPGSSWLFPGRRADQPLYPEHLAALIHQLGVPTVAGRGAAIRQYVLDMPAPVVADALGYHHVTTIKLAGQAGATWSRYAPGDHSQP